MKNPFIFFSLITIISCFSGCTTGVQSPQPEDVQSAGDYYVAAYIWPSCHDDPLAREKIWPEGLGEWEVIKKGNPRFDGHYQPRQPLWGYEADNDPEVVEKWIDV
ncbi:MAG: glycoside hydrolase family 99-like domain-containing protein, partial [Bacteroidales bacterium]|nr:glycoside hydrolase family 99-like domain-containing protein [Bacteroidales bacterium]